MGLMAKFFNNTRKPEGFLGKMMVNGMNGGGHAALAEWGLSFVNIGKNDSALDCGCGCSAFYRHSHSEFSRGRNYFNAAQKRGCV